jgi:fructose-bisphosphate aldolase, class I
MSIGKEVRLNRIFGHPSGKLCSVAVDHFIGYAEGLPPGLRSFQATLAEVASASPDAITMHIGMARHSWHPYAGRIPLIVQSVVARPDDSAFEGIATPADAIRVGADAIAVAVFLRGATEGHRLRFISEQVRAADEYELPVICHVYPRNFEGGKVTISYLPEDIAWAVRCAVEVGADVVKVPYCGDVSAYRQIVNEAPVPVVAAGGPRQGTQLDALRMMSDVMKAGAYGATIGRNIWGFDGIAQNVEAFKAVIHDGVEPGEALKKAGK